LFAFFSKAKIKERKKWVGTKDGEAAGYGAGFALEIGLKIKVKNWVKKFFV